MRNNVMEDLDWIPVEIDNEEQLTLLSAVCQVVEVVKNSHNDPRIYEVAARPIAYIKDLLCLTEKQVVAYAIVMDMYYDNQISTFDIARCLDITPLKAMTFRADLEELCRRNYLVENTEEDATDKSYSVTKEAIASLQQDCAICYCSSIVESVEDWFSALNKIISARCNRRIDYETLCMRVEDLIKQNDKKVEVQRGSSFYRREDAILLGLLYGGMLRIRNNGTRQLQEVVWQPYCISHSKQGAGIRHKRPY